MAVSQGRMITFLFLAGLLQCATAATYTVGDATGWTFPPTATFYDEWANNHTFKVGDQLVFPYTSGVHDVFQVSEADLASCTKTSPIQTWTDTNSTVTLTAAGSHYYICSIGTHCAANMHMSLQVVAADSPAGSPPSASPTSTPPASGPSTPTPPPPPPATPTTTTPSALSPAPPQSGAFTLKSGSTLFFAALAAGWVAILI
ncbi:hypothetical protein AXG93_1406s1070 [Marchantia polymorpha subsp. ruderalis]|nr:hypothetical protein AXG93_1406s1070 [Marchantia polymorpha subsp. ruderalis]